MSIRPFSTSEISNLRALIEKDGWKLNGATENYFRYSIQKDKLLIFTIKIPVGLPVRLNIPFEVVNFQISIAFRIWDFNQNTTRVILYFLKTLRDLALQASIEHHFPLEGREKELVNLLNLIIPEVNNEENDSSWKNRIRVSLMNKRDTFTEFDNVKINDIVAIINKSSGLEPSFKIPWELSKGIPKIRTPETLFFSNDEVLDEFFMLEKGYFTYFKDLEYDKIFIRTFFDSYSPYLLYTLFKDAPDFNLEVFIENWIKYSRMMLNSIIEIINTASINPNDLIKINYDREIDNVDYISEENNFAFSALHYECKIAKELFPIHNDLLNKPPTNFEVIESINYYTRAEELIKKYKFEEATQLLNEALKIFNKNRQRKVVVSILLQLRKISSLLNQNTISLNYLKSALGVAKSGDVPIDYIMHIHYKLGKTYYILKQIDEALNHFNILMSFLENEEVDIKNKEEYLGMVYLWVGLIYSEKKEANESQKLLKKAFQIGNQYPRVKLKMSLERARYYKNIGNTSQAQKRLKIGLDSIDLELKEIDPRVLHTIIDLIMDMAEFYIHFRKDSKKAMALLNSVSDHQELKEIPGMHRAVRWNLLMADFYNFCVKNPEKKGYYLYQSRELKGKLRSVGVSEY